RRQIRFDGIAAHEVGELHAPNSFLLRRERRHGITRLRRRSVRLNSLSKISLSKKSHCQKSHLLKSKFNRPQARAARRGPAGAGREFYGDLAPSACISSTAARPCGCSRRSKPSIRRP